MTRQGCRDLRKALSKSDVLQLQHSFSDTTNHLSWLPSAIQNEIDQFLYFDFLGDNPRTFSFTLQKAPQTWKLLPVTSTVLFVCNARQLQCWNFKSLQVTRQVSRSAAPQYSWQ